jgi:Flp pilus assembly protein TadG
MRAFSTTCSSQRRKGAVAVWLVVTGPILLLVFVMAVDTCSRGHRQLELQIAHEAAALAAANSLVDEALLTEQEAAAEEVVAHARTAALRYAAFNRFMTQPLHLDANVSNRVDGDLVLGTLDNPFSNRFEATSRVLPGIYEPRLNAVRVAGVRHKVGACATAMVDRDVLGFRITGTQALPG